MTEIATSQTVRDLRRRWKPHKERLAALGGEQPTSIRFHRACSWMARVEQMPDGQDHDLGMASWGGKIRILLARNKITRCPPQANFRG